MIILGIIIGILFMVLGTIADDFDTGEIVGGIGVIIIVVSLIGGFICFGQIGKSRIIDDKISMYQKENKNIEKQMDILVKQYMFYESETIKEFKSESSITLVTMYPNLKADTLVQTQITTYTDNNNKIKELKENKLNYKLAKWWLYFG